ncbi:MFS transporter [Thermomonospora amylolytica]|uniref:MFS transporter n=1 Tax=Thermomonospora amylolytica TaxID=1411117 RepID=UPI000E6C8AF4|nr:MFS transporter [Thermomonospora amylolytica]
MTQISAPPTTGTRPERHRWRWVALAVILCADVMDLLDATVTNIAAPAIQADLGGSYASLQWLGAAYTLAMAIGLITGGRLGDVHGRRRMFLIGVAGFTAASLACALAPGPGALIGFRAVQGLFGALLIPQGLGLITEMFDESERAAAFGLFGPVLGLSAVGGPVLAGWLVDADLFGTGWRMIFLINLPLGLAALAAGLRVLPAARPAKTTRLDPVGALLAALGSLLVIYPLVQGHELGWPGWSFAMMAAAVPVFALFARYERRVLRAGGDPLVTPELFRSRAFTGGLLFGTLFFAAMIGFSLVLGLFMQLGLGYSALGAGLAAAPWAVGMVLGFAVAQGLARRHGRLSMQLGALVMAAGIAGAYATVHWAGADVTAWRLVPALLVTGLGTSMVMAPFFDIVLAGVRPEQTGSASGSLTAVQQLGGALGIALLGTLFFDALGGRAERTAFVGALERTLLVELAVLVLIWGLTFLLPRRARPDGPAGH